MSQKSITFRCSASQISRMNTAMQQTNTTRTNFITTALKSFLTYAGQPSVRHMNLFELVGAIDSLGDKTSFEEQA